MRTSFRKVIGEFDRITIASSYNSEWLDIQIEIGNGQVVVNRICLRSDDAVGDLYYALGCYLKHIKENK